MQSVRSSILPDGFAFREKGLHALLLVLAVEQIDESFAFQRQCSAARSTEPRLMDQILAERHGARTQGTGALGYFHGSLTALPAGNHLFDQTYAQGGLRADSLVGENHA